LKDHEIATGDYLLNENDRTQGGMASNRDKLNPAEQPRENRHLATPTGVRDDQSVLLQLDRQIARIAAIATDAIAGARHEALTFVDRWVGEYGDYQSGGWWTTSLLNESGDPADVLIRDCRPAPTNLLLRMPQTQHLLDGLGLNYMWARLGRLESNSYLWEHRDYAELADAERIRFHIPLCTNSSAFLVIGGCRVHLGVGSMWLLVPTHSHGVCNLYGPDRIHLIIDCYADQQLGQLTANASLADSDVTALPIPGDRDLAHHASVAQQLLQLGYRRTAELYVLRLFYQYALPAGRTYDMLVELYRRLGDEDSASEWLLRKSVLMASREEKA
jgi:hypothetical protein